MCIRDRRFHLHELAAEVVAGNLGHRGDRIRRDALPTGDARVDSVLQCTLAEIHTPRPAWQIDLDGAVERHHPARAVTAEDHWAEVAAVETVPLYQLTTGGDELVEGILDLHPVDLARVEHPLEMLSLIHISEP